MDTSTALNWKLKELDKQLAKLADTRSEIIQELKTAETAARKKILTDWKLDTAMRLVCISKDSFVVEPWIRTFQLQECTSTCIDVIEGVYDNRDYNYHYHVATNRFDVFSFAELAETYNIYIVSAAQLNNYSSIFSNLSIPHALSINEFESKVKKDCYGTLE